MDEQWYELMTGKTIEQHWCEWMTGKKVSKFNGEVLRQAFEDGWKGRGNPEWYSNDSIDGTSPREAYLAGRKYGCYETI